MSYQTHGNPIQILILLIFGWIQLGIFPLVSIPIHSTQIKFDYENSVSLQDLLPTFSFHR